MPHTIPHVVDRFASEAAVRSIFDQSGFRPLCARKGHECRQEIIPIRAPEIFRAVSAERPGTLVGSVSIASIHVHDSRAAESALVKAKANYARLSQKIGDDHLVISSNILKGYVSSIDESLSVEFLLRQLMFQVIHLS